MAVRDYSAAIAALNTLQPNHAAVNAFKSSGPGLNSISIRETTEYLHRIGHKPNDLNSLNPIHIAGTKGKGSTAAFISSVLCQYAHSSKENAPTKIGLYTSPHLMSVRERIRINDEPLSEERFAYYFFEVWDRLEVYASNHGPLELEYLKPGGETKPMYFKFLTLLAFHVYLEEKVDTAIFECGIGGEYDATNILEAPTVCAITTLDIDHVAMLGDTIESIAWHKAGIFKQGTRCREGFTVASQPEAAITVISDRARDKQMGLKLIPTHPMIEDGSIQLGLKANFQKANASLAISVVVAHLRIFGISDLPDFASSSPEWPIEFTNGLKTVKWSGRCETRHERGISWRIDGGHTNESIKLAAQWFATCLSQSNRQRRILVFNQQTRDAVALARSLHAALAAGIAPRAPERGASKEQPQPLFDRAIFCTNVTFAAQKGATDTGGYYKADLASINANLTEASALTVQNQLAQVWEELDPGCRAEVRGTIQEAVETVRGLAKEGDNGEEVEIFATGSLHLVGGLLEILESTGVFAETQ